LEKRFLLCACERSAGAIADQMPAATQGSQSVCRGAGAKTRVPTLILVGDADIPDVPAHAGAREVGRSAWSLMMRGIWRIWNRRSSAAWRCFSSNQIAT